MEVIVVDEVVLLLLLLWWRGLVSLASLQHSPSMLVYLSGTIAICLFKAMRKVHKYWCLLLPTEKALRGQ